MICVMLTTPTRFSRYISSWGTRWEVLTSLAVGVIVNLSLLIIFQCLRTISSTHTQAEIQDNLIKSIVLNLRTYHVYVLWMGKWALGVSRWDFSYVFILDLLQFRDIQRLERPPMMTQILAVIKYRDANRRTRIIFGLCTVRLVRFSHLSILDGWPQVYNSSKCAIQSYFNRFFFTTSTHS